MIDRLCCDRQRRASPGRSVPFISIPLTHSRPFGDRGAPQLPEHRMVVCLWKQRRIPALTPLCCVTFPQADIHPVLLRLRPAASVSPAAVCVCSRCALPMTNTSADQEPLLSPAPFSTEPMRPHRSGSHSNAEIETSKSMIVKSTVNIWFYFRNLLIKRLNSKIWYFVQTRKIQGD